MPRKPRLQAAGLPVHIIQRGNNRQACFFADEDIDVTTLRRDGRDDVILEKNK